MCEECYPPTPAPEEIAEAADECVQRGIAWLDENGPADWRSRVDLVKLNIMDVQLCILGQVFKDKANNPEFMHSTYYSDRVFDSGYDYAVLTLLDGEFNDNVTGALGFSEYGEVYASAMAEEWKRALSA